MVVYVWVYVQAHAGVDNAHDFIQCQCLKPFAQGRTVDKNINKRYLQKLRWNKQFNIIESLKWFYTEIDRKIEMDKEIDR